MLRRRNILLAVVLTAVIGVFLASVLYKGGEPCHRGKSLSSWIEMYLRASDKALAPHEQRDRVDEAVRKMGTNTIPYLLEWYAYDKWPRMEKADAFYTSLPRTFRTNMTVVRLLYADPKERRSICALMALAAVDPQLLQSNPSFIRFVSTMNTFAEWHRVDRLVEAITALRSGHIEPALPPSGTF